MIDEQKAGRIRESAAAAAKSEPVSEIRLHSQTRTSGQWFRIRYHQSRGAMAASGGDRAPQTGKRGIRGAVPRLIERLGFVERRRAGSHRIYRHSIRPEVPLINLQAGPSGKAKPYQVRQVLGIMDAHGVEVGE